MKIILDTNVLHQEGLFSKNMQILMRMVESKDVEVKVPELVRREFISKVVIDSQAGMQNAKRAMAEYKKRFERESPIALELEKIEKLLASAEEGVKSSVEATFKYWSAKNEIEILKFDDLNINKVFDDYFSGGGAFRAIKKRDDIPDSIIGYCIVEFMKFNENVIVIVKDGAFKNYLSTLKDLKIYDSVEDFLSTPDVKVIKARLDATDRDIEDIKAFLMDSDIRKRFSDFILSDDDVFSDIYIEEETIVGIEKLGMPVFGVSINGANKENSEIEFGDVEYISPGSFSIAVKINSHSCISYCTDYSTYGSLPKIRSELLSFDGMDGRGVVEVSEGRNVLLSGYIEIHFDVNFKVDELNKYLRKFEKGSSEIEVDVNIVNAEIF